MGSGYNSQVIAYKSIDNLGKRIPKFLFFFFFFFFFFCPNNICIKNQQNARILHDSCPRKLSKYPNFYICPKNLQNFRILHDFCPKNARILHNNCPRNIFPEF